MVHRSRVIWLQDGVLGHYWCYTAIESEQFIPSCLPHLSPSVPHPTCLALVTVSLRILKKWKWDHSVMSNSAILWTVARQAPLPSMGFSRQEYWSGLLFSSPGDLPDPGIEPGSPTFQADASPSESPGIHRSWGSWGGLIICSWLGLFPALGLVPYSSSTFPPADKHALISRIIRKSPPPQSCWFLLLNLRSPWPRVYPVAQFLTWLSPDCTHSLGA